MGGLGVLALAAPVCLGASPSLRAWCYRETSYRVVLSRILQPAGTLTPEDITLRIAGYIHRQVYQGGGSVMDVDAWTHLVRGIGWCDQKAWAIGTLLAIQGIHSRLAFLYNQHEAGGHVVLEVLIDGRWRMLDPSYNVFFEAPDGGPETLEAVAADVALVLRQPTVAALDPEARGLVFERYARLFPPGEPLRHAPVRWASILDARRADPKKAAAEGLVDWCWNTFGTAWAHSVQDVYLALFRLGPPARDGRTAKDLERGFSMRQLTTAKHTYYRGRNYQLYGRPSAAEREYRNLLDTYPGTMYARRAHYWLGTLAMATGDADRAVETFDQLLRAWPEFSWRTRIYEPLARAYLQQGRLERARQCEALALGDPLVPTASRIAGRY